MRRKDSRSRSPLFSSTFFFRSPSSSSSSASAPTSSSAAASSFGFSCTHLFFILLLCATVWVALASTTPLWMAQEEQEYDATGVRLERDFGDFTDGYTHGRQLSQEPLIQNGKKAKPGQFSYMVALLDREDTQKCGGVLINPSWVLTAAHCLDKNILEGIDTLGLNPQLKLGALRLNDTDGDGGVEITVGKGILHPLWDGDIRNGFDLALLELPNPTSITPIALPAQNQILSAGDPLLAMGWGVLGNQKKDNVLRWGTQFYVSNEECDSPENWNGRIIDEMLCARGKDEDVCEGDSGGALIIPADTSGDGVPNVNPGMDVLVGVTSFREDICDNENSNIESRQPAIFTRASEFLGWIEETINGTQPPPSPPSPQQPVPSPVPTQSPSPNPTSIPMPTPDPSPSPSPPRPVPSPAPAPAPAPAPPPPVISPPQPPMGSSGGNLGAELLAASEMGQLGIVTELVDRGADINHKGVFGWTPLIFASISGHAEVVQYLVGRGAALDIQSSRSGNTALMSAALNGQEKIVEILVNAGADVEVMNARRKRARDLICQASGINCTEKVKRRIKRLLR